MTLKEPPLDAIADRDVRAVFAAYPRETRVRLLNLRNLIPETAATTQGAGEIEETLKWGQPSYLTSTTKSGTTIRIDAVKGDPTRYALYVNCQTNLIEIFRELYPDALSLEGNRAVLFNVADTFPHDIISHCVSLALTYHRNKVRRHL